MLGQFRVLNLRGKVERFELFRAASKFQFSLRLAVSGFGFKLNFLAFEVVRVSGSGTKGLLTAGAGGYLSLAKLQRTNGGLGFI